MLFPEKYRFQQRGHAFDSTPGETFGVFVIPPQKLDRTTTSRGMQVIATDGMMPDGTQSGWEHVSVSLLHRKQCPSWEEMCLVKRLFWEPTAWVVQYHPSEENYVNISEVLHLWRSTITPFPTPPVEFV